MSYRMTEHTHDYKQQIAALRSRTWGGSPDLNASYLEWKYERNPYIEQPLLYIALFEDEVVGMHGMYGSAWQTASMSEPYVVPCAADFIVDPEHRRRKLGLRLTRFKMEAVAKKGVRHAMTLSANQYSRKLYFKSGYDNIAEYVGFRFGAASTPSLLARSLNRLRRKLSSPQPKIAFSEFDAWAKGLRGDLHVTDKPRCSEMSALVLHNYTGSTLRSVRDRDYYRWRFDNPLSEYRFVFHEDAGKLDGFLVLQQSIFGGLTTIIDWETVSGEVWSKLIDTLVAGNSEPINIASTNFTRDQAEQLLRAGFEPTDDPGAHDQPGPGVFLKILADGPDTAESREFHESLTSRKLKMRMICSDAF